MSDFTIPSPDHRMTHNIRADGIWWHAADNNAIDLAFPSTDYVWQYVRVLIWAIPE
jgi:hypothetical protein